MMRRNLLFVHEKLKMWTVNWIKGYFSFKLLVKNRLDHDNKSGYSEVFLDVFFVCL